VTDTPAELAAIVAVTSRYVQAEGPNEDYPPGGYVPQAERRWYVEAALGGVELGRYDRRIVAWLAQWDDYTARLVVSLLVRARRAGYAEAASAGDGTVVPPAVIDSEAWACRGCGGLMIGRRPLDDRCEECGGTSREAAP
jgi:hypothetical protein